MQLSYWLGFCCCFSSSTVCLWWSLILCGWCIWVFTHLYKPHLISWIASKNYFIRNLCHCSVFGDVCPRGCFLSKLTSVVRWHVFPFMTWKIMAGCQLISLAEKELTTSANCLGKQRHGVLWGCNWVKKLVRQTEMITGSLPLSFSLFRPVNLSLAFYFRVLPTIWEPGTG